LRPARAINVGVAGHTPKEELPISLARTPTKHVRNLSRYKKRSQKACLEREVHARLDRYQQLLLEATHRRGHTRHIIELPARVVKQYRDAIAECQLELSELSQDPDGVTVKQCVPVWFVGDLCSLRWPAPSSNDAAADTPVGAMVKEPTLTALQLSQLSPVSQAAEDTAVRSARVAYVGRLPRRLGGGVWVGVALEAAVEGGHDGKLKGVSRRCFECEIGHGIFCRPTDLATRDTLSSPVQM
jgi:hypothetical protein